MPREVKAYGCEFKCGAKVVLSKKSMIDHESRCFWNPEKKACATCVYFKKEYDDNGMTGANKESWVDLICNAKQEHLIKLENNCHLYKEKP